MLILIDNYDSFTYNLVQYFQVLGQEVQVFTHDTVSIEEIERSSPQYLVVSPGPNGPTDAGISLPLIKHFYPHLPILGVCLGHQCLAHAFGADIVPANEIKHGKTSPIFHHKQGIFRDLPNAFQAMRYHSLVVDLKTLPPCFSVDAWAEDTIMAISHRQYPLFGLQFHPESIVSEQGLSLLNNFLNYANQ